MDEDAETPTNSGGGVTLLWVANFVDKCSLQYAAHTVISSTIQFELHSPVSAENDASLAFENNTLR